MLISPPIHSDGAKGIAMAQGAGFEVYSFKKSGDFEGHKWYRILGKGLARERQDAILCGLPRGYALGGRKDSRRNDKFIFGHPSKRAYRSAREFIPHLQHLQSLDRKHKSTESANCECHLCKSVSNNSRRSSDISSCASSSTARRLPPLKMKTGTETQRRQTSTTSASSSNSSSTTTAPSKKRTLSSMTGMKENNNSETKEEKEPKKKRQLSRRKKIVKTKKMAGQELREVAYVWIETPPSLQDLPIPDYIDIPDLVLPSNHCLL
ncbi:hypothetical protein BDB00DRAFT_103061 [Zychaea mexicana]|uniref:uncharacterized protein n=1 Tax=Zychaea mexicana TaxID=64656 RepID=UPI0022FE1115|nr:uncharacterized protein BDB00DRAFT_103061 [Zychaea mexicana]KAI9496680.1 hypothetical protein BDB00DRAFT_103061 [Zychaea mexicana]